MKKQTVNEDYLWAELKGNEEAIRDLMEKQNVIRRELTHAMIEKIKSQEAL